MCYVPISGADSYRESAGYRTGNQAVICQTDLKKRSYHLLWYSVSAFMLGSFLWLGANCTCSISLLCNHRAGVLGNFTKSPGDRNRMLCSGTSSAWSTLRSKRPPKKNLRPYNGSGTVGKNSSTFGRRNGNLYCGHKPWRSWQGTLACAIAFQSTKVPWTWTWAMIKAR